MQTTKAKSFVQTCREGKPPTQQARILAHLRGPGIATRAELCAATGIMTSAMCARLNEMVKDGRILEALTTTLDPDTNREVTQYILPPLYSQP